MTLHNLTDHCVKRPCWFAKQRHHTPSFCHENTVKGYVFVASFFGDKNCPTQGRVIHMNCWYLIKKRHGSRTLQQTIWP